MPDDVLTPFKNKEERASERDRKREAVLLAAVRMFNERGFEATSLDNVAASIGISKPTIYHYLGNKEQVLLECVTRGMDQLYGAASKAQTVAGTGLERLAAFLILYAELNMTEFGRCVIRTSAKALSPEGADRFRALKRKIDGDIRDFVAAAMADGSAAPGDVKLTAFALAGALNGPGFWFSPDGPLPARAIAEELVAILLAGLKPRADRSAR
jgi:AcrR family transcriptional regulator